jgi:precorrin-3B synthase
LDLEAIEIKGWCPGALRPMPSGDGLIVRIRPLLGRIDVTDLLALGEAAARFGNGQIDLTRRSNLQLRGVTRASLAGLQNEIRRMGLLDNDAGGEAVRNIIVSPVTGIDSTEVVDVRNVAMALTRLLLSTQSLWALPNKFGFVVDGGGALDLCSERADIRLTAVSIDGAAKFAVGLDNHSGTVWLGAVAPDVAADMSVALASAFIDMAARGQRMRDISEDDMALIRSRVAASLGPLQEQPSAPPAQLPRRVGLLNFGGNRFAIGVAAPFGRIEPDHIRTLAGAMMAAGITQVRLSPWRVLYAQVADPLLGHRVLESATGWIVSPHDPLLRIVACPGAPSCASARLDTRSTARALAARLPHLDFTGTVHVSGCAKGCAKSAPSELVLVGAGDHFGIVRNGTARDPFSDTISGPDLAAYPDRIFRPKAWHD